MTGPGSLAASHNVKKICRVAAVRGALDKGYQQVDNIDTCLLRALDTMDGPEGDGVTSILIPMLGAGRGGGQRKETATVLVSAAVNYLERHAQNTRLRGVYFLAWTDKDLAALELAFKEFARSAAAAV